MNLGLFGGTFDPIHAGHLSIATCAWREQKLDRVLFVPARQSPFKTGLPQASDSQRCDMIELAIQDLPWAGLWTGELDRPAPSYTWQTAAFFRNSLPNATLFWILGADQWDTVRSWARPEYLAQALTFLVFTRETRPEPQPGFHMQPLPAVHPASSTAIRQGHWEHLDPRVARYIRRHGIYPRADAESSPGLRPDHSGSTAHSDPDRGP